MSDGDGALREVVQHLMFHQALIDDRSSGDRFDEYIRMARDIDRGVYVAGDPVERAISLVFELVLKEKMDPWAIDLVRFAELYAERISHASTIDLVVSGKVLHLAWSILKMQSGLALSDIQGSLVSGDKDDEEDEAAPSDLDGGCEMVFDPFSDGLDGAVVDLQPVVTREPTRPVSLMDLVDAFNEAKHEIRVKGIVARKRREVDGGAVPSFRRKVHSEDLEREICMVWQRILSFNGDPIPLVNLHMRERSDFVTVFISVLFLAKLGKIELWQEGLPEGEIYIRNVSGGSRLTFVRDAAEREISAEISRCMTA